MNNHIYKPSDIINNYDLFLVDVWGVICNGLSVYPGVVENLNLLSQNKPLCYVSNSPRLKDGLKARLDGFGIKTSEDMLYSSGEVASLMINNSEKYLGIKNPIIYELTDDYFKNIYAKTNWNFVDKITDANILLVTAQMKEGDDLTKYDPIIEEAAKFGLVCICPNPDTIIPDGDSKTYCPGYIVRNYSGKLIYTGKPHPYIFQPILEKYGHIPKNRILMIGDTVDMDILGARNVGIESALVPTGNAKLLREKFGLAEDSFRDIRKYTDIQPSILLDLS